MVNVTIDGKQVAVADGTTILDAAREVGISIPTLCYLANFNHIGACRVCVVEVEGINRLISSCNTPVREGMVVYTNSPKVRRARRTNTAIMLSHHDCNCPTCVRSGNCTLQDLANSLGLLEVEFPKKLNTFSDDKNFPLIRDNAKCINCMRCVQVCEKIQGIGVWDLISTGTQARVDVANHRSLTESDCVLCGQCITHCPCGALRERDDTQRVFDALGDPEVTTIIQVAPAVRTSWYEGVGLPQEQGSVGRMVAAIRALGFDYVFDTDFSADVTIMEEGTELLHHLAEPEKHAWPMITSCCPGWIRHCKAANPDFVDRLSTTKSPQQIFGALAKSYYAQILGIDPKKLFVVSVMPCLAKKAECDYGVIDNAGAGNDVDIALTVRELDRMIRADHINVAALEEEEWDMPLGVASGAGHIFGVTGGVMEAALRTAAAIVNGEDPDPDLFGDIREREGWREYSYQLGEKTLKIAVAHGLNNADAMLDAIRKGQVSYDFVEVMACPGGCAGGGGQPIHEGQELAGDRADILYGLDAEAELRFSHNNPSVTACYQQFLGEPNSELAEELLHTNHHLWTMPNEKPVKA
jgi:NADH-quinone oxidoreductase subunit G